MSIDELNWDDDAKVWGLPVQWDIPRLRSDPNFARVKPTTTKHAQIRDGKDADDQWEILKTASLAAERPQKKNKEDLMKRAYPCQDPGCNGDDGCKPIMVSNDKPLELDTDDF